MGNKFIDLTGQKFGRWTVIDYFGRMNNMGHWNCVCSCGIKKIVEGYSLRSGNSKSCGCYNRESTTDRNFKDLTNIKFGKLTVVSLFKLENNSFYWNCLCDCGNEIIVPSKYLGSGNTKSCGCLGKEVLFSRNFDNLINERFGKVVVVEKSTPINKKSRWVCMCDCGNKFIANSNDLKSGATRSCGCQRESFISSELKIYFNKKYSAISEYKILRNPRTGWYLPYDIYLPNENIFIEVQGKQHYSKNNYFTKSQEDFDYLKYKDKIKRKFARENGTYIEIDLRKIKTPEEAISYIESFM